MLNEWNQIDFVLEKCPIHGYRITQIPVRTNYDINRDIYSTSEQPLIFPIDSNIIHNIPNEPFIEPNREKYYSLNNYNNYNDVQEEQNYQNRSYNNYNISGFQPDNDFNDNYSVYLSRTSRLKPRVTINNVSNLNHSQIIDNFNQQQRYNYNFPSYDDNNRNIKNYINNGYTIKDSKSYNGKKLKKKKAILYNYQYKSDDEPMVIKTEPDEIFEENNNYNKRKYYYYTPNYYNDSDEDSNLDTKKYYINRNINKRFKTIDDNSINERMLEDNNLYSKKI